MSHTVTHSVVVTDPIGLHARPIGQIVALVKGRSVTVHLKRPDGPPVEAVSALKLLAMKVKTAEELEVVVEADSLEDAEHIARTIESLINQG